MNPTYDYVNLLNVVKKVLVFDHDPLRPRDTVFWQETWWRWDDESYLEREWQYMANGYVAKVVSDDELNRFYDVIGLNYSAGDYAQWQMDHLNLHRDRIMKIWKRKDYWKPLLLWADLQPDKPLKGGKLTALARVVRCSDLSRFLREF